MLPVYWPRLGHFMHARNTYTMSCTIMYIDSHMYEVLKVKINFPIENYSIYMYVNKFYTYIKLHPIQYIHNRCNNYVKNAIIVYL